MAGWLDEIDPATSPPYVRMGTRALRAGGRGAGSAGWLLGGDDVPAQLVEKRRILDAHHDEVIATLDGSEDAAAELLATVLAYLARGPAVPDGEPAPAAARGASIEVAGRLVAEDLCIVQRRDGAWVLTAGSVCFPSHWRLRDKLGLPLADVHDPVPDYADDLASRVDRFLDKLRVGSGVWRRNWTIHADPELYAPAGPPPPDPPISVHDAGQRLWLRSERQTLTRLPRTGAVAFTIRTQQVPLEEVAAHPPLCRRLRAAIAAWPPHQVAYRGGEAIRQPLLAWLGAVG